MHPNTQLGDLGHVRSENAPPGLVGVRVFLRVPLPNGSQGSALNSMDSIEFNASIQVPRSSQYLPFKKDEVANY